MGHYDKYQRKQERKQETNPIWRGIGCVLIVVVLLMSYALTAISVPPLITTGLVPPELLGKIGFPDWVFRTPVLSGIATFLHGFDHLGMSIIVFLVILLLLTGISSLIYTAVLQVIGPPRYGELDAPPSKHKAKAYKR